MRPTGRADGKQSIRDRMLLHGRAIVRDTLGTAFSLVQGCFLKRTLAVVGYHDVSHQPGMFSHRHNVSPAVFEWQMDFIRAHFNLIGPDELFRGDLPERALMITFDDGYKGIFRNALPVLKSRGIPATIFLNMHAIRGGVPWSALLAWLCGRDDFRNFCYARKLYGTREIPLSLKCGRVLVEEFLETCDREDVMVQVKAFMGEFGSEDDLLVADGSSLFYGNHLYDHDLPLLMTDREFEVSYERNTMALSSYRNYRPLFAIPYGQPRTCFDAHHVEMLAGFGIKKVFYSSGGINRMGSGVLLDRFEFQAHDEYPARMWYSLYKALTRKRIPDYG